jgi:hypothetical protein
LEGLPEISCYLTCRYKVMEIRTGQNAETRMKRCRVTFHQFSSSFEIFLLAVAYNLFVQHPVRRVCLDLNFVTGYPVFLIVFGQTAPPNQIRQIQRLDSSMIFLPARWNLKRSRAPKKAKGVKRFVDASATFHASFCVLICNSLTFTSHFYDN